MSQKSTDTVTTFTTERKETDVVVNGKRLVIYSRPRNGTVENIAVWEGT